MEQSPQSHSPDIRLAEPEDAEAVTQMLADLAESLGDGEAFSSTPEIIRQYGSGANAHFSVMLAEDAGLCLFFRHFSTTRGQPGVYVQDLWVSPSARGQDLGKQLLAATAAYAAQSWGAQYMSLTTHGHNAAARRFYHRLSFTAAGNDIPMHVSGANFQTLSATFKEASTLARRH